MEIDYKGIAKALVEDGRMKTSYGSYCYCKYDILKMLDIDADIEQIADALESFEEVACVDVDKAHDELCIYFHTAFCPDLVEEEDYE